MATTFMSGAMMMAAFVSGLFFLKFWRKTKDRFFAIFAIAFWMLACERWLLLKYWINVDETQTWVFFVRLCAFLLIIMGVIDKNRKKA